MKYICKFCHDQFELKGLSQLCPGCGDPVDMSLYVTYVSQTAIPEKILRILRTWAWPVYTSEHCFVGRTNKRLLIILRHEVKQIQPQALIIGGYR